MDQSDVPQNRKTQRANVLMQASLELSGTSLPVKLRNLSSEGALVESDKLPVEGSAVVFRRGDLAVPGRIAWTKTRHAGVSFNRKLEPEQVLRHVPQPRAPVAPSYRRPGLKAQSLTEQERRFGEMWLRTGAVTPLGE